MEKEELEAILHYYDDLYYNQDTSEIDDVEYDSLKNYYVEKYGEYNYVPGEASDKFEKFEHTTYVSSLDKVQITEENKIREHLKRLWPVVIQPKMDGLTIVCYRVGNKVIYVTRGNGRIGEIVTITVEQVEGLGEPFVFPVRMEVVMLHSYFDEINKEREEQGLKPYDNCRNAAAGMLRNLDPSKVKGLKAFAYNLLFGDEDEDPYEDDEEEDENPNATAQVQIEYLKNNGWNTVNSYVPENIDDAVNYIMNYDRESLDYDIDGLVIKHNGNIKFGQTEHHPLNAVAVKFVPPGAWTKIIGIKNTVGRTGKITPVIQLQPVQIAGSTVTKATGDNYEILAAKGLVAIETYKKFGEPLTEAYVVKSNDVIPKMLEVRYNNHKDMENIYAYTVIPPDKCPACGGPIKKIGVNLFCTNELCSGKAVNRLIHMASKEGFDIEGLGEETAPKLIDKAKEIYKKTLNQMKMTDEVATCEKEACDPEMYEIFENKLKYLHPSLIYDLSYKDILSIEGFAELSAQKLYKAIQKSKVLPFNKFLYGCGIPLVGKKAARDIAEFYFNDKQNELFEFIDDYNNGFKKLRTLKGIGEETINNINKYYDALIVPFGDYIDDYQDVIPKKKAANQKTFVITGEFEIPRKDIKKMIEEAGHKLTGSVSSKTFALLAAPGESGTEKYKKAESIGTKIVNSIEELKDLF